MTTLDEVRQRDAVSAGQRLILCKQLELAAQFLDRKDCHTMGESVRKAIAALAFADLLAADRDALKIARGQPVPLSEWEQMVAQRDSLLAALRALVHVPAVKAALNTSGKPHVGSCACPWCKAQALLTLAGE